MTNKATSLSHTSIFIKETLQLLWWAFFQPGQLQTRLNEWVPQQDKEGKQKATTFRDLLRGWRQGKMVRRLLAQFSLLWLIAAVPVGWLISRGAWENGYIAALLIVALPLTAAGFAYFDLYALSFVTPLLIALPILPPTTVTALNEAFADPEIISLLWRGPSGVGG
ncbi:MAG: hypothetical protein KC419_12525, partial [Anaerolineales bacterium]|nr:hypothetical protein [Anaerolineales bacterium]